MLAFGIVCALVVTASAGYASTSTGGAGLYNSNAGGQTYGSKYPYSNQYSGYASAGGSGGAFPFYQPYAPLPPFASPYDFQNAFQQNQAYGGAGAQAGSGGYGGGSTGSYGGVSGGQSYGGTYGGNPGYAPNYASAGGAVGNGYQQQHANIYPANPARPNLDSRFGGDDGAGASFSSQGGPGFVGVSSFSSSSDVNGVRNREAATSVNNNGKVTTYHTKY